MPKISVIIPVYNTELYVAETLDSVINQTFTDWEAICIDDGSTDNSLRILKQYAKQDKRIRIIKQKNRGVVSARNTAINQSKSEYIYPLDSDDVIAPNCLEKLYNAIISGKGDIITSRVMYFGRKHTEYVLKKPTKYNMARNNCLVNAALFKKSDFENCGGYDTAFNIALEDYDFWLNMLFNKNKKIYRVPEILFFYRLKQKTDSRNYQNRSKHRDLIRLLYKKYPSMKKYVLFGKFIKPFRKLFRFIFKIQDNRIKIFKIPVYKLHKYDTVISVGSACFVPDVLKKLKLRDFSGPFDWMYGSDVLTRLKFVKNEFKNYFNFEDFELVGENPDNGKMVYKNTRSGIVYNHDFPHGDFKNIFGTIATKYQRRTERMVSQLDNDRDVLLVFSELGQSCTTDKLIKMIDAINKKFSANIDLLYIAHDSNIALGHFVKPKRISKHLIYAKYHYDKFPDELSQARKILKKILRKVAR